MCTVGMVFITTVVVCSMSQNSFISVGAYGTCCDSYSSAIRITSVFVFSVRGVEGGIKLLNKKHVKSPRRGDASSKTDTVGSRTIGSNPSH